MTVFGLLRFTAAEFSINRPLTNGLLYRTRPGFILRPLLDKALLSERRAHLVEILLADFIVVVTVAAFMRVEDFMVAGLEAVLMVVIDKNGTIFKQNER